MEIDFDKSNIVQWYKGRNIFITGGTGYMGKVLVEKLLYSCKEIGNLYILMRSKRGRTPEQRIDDMWQLPVFQRLRKSNPDAKKKIIPMYGDLVTDNLGLSEENKNVLLNTVSVVFHCAATLKLEAILKDAIEQNTAGTLRVVDLAKQIKKLDAFIHMSTAFCSADMDIFEEKVYDCNDNPRDVINAMQWMNDDALLKATPDLIAPHPNTYTYSKRLAETLVANEAKHMRVAIVRPSLVTPSANEPVPGWVDSLNGPIGILVAAGKGVLRSMHCKAELRCQVVPVDIAINAMIVVAYNLGSAKEQPKEVPVYNFTNDGVIPYTWGQIFETSLKTVHKYPFEMMVWYPDGNIRSSYFIHRLYCIFFQWLPAYFIDFLMFVLCQKRFMVRVQQKIHDGLELLQFFTTRPWNFKSENFLALSDNLSPQEKQIFQMDFYNPPLEKYFEYSVLGARQYCMKENLSSLPRCRVQQSVLYVLHNIFVLAFYLGFVWMMYSCFDTVKDGFDYTGNLIKNLPVMGRWKQAST